MTVLCLMEHDASGVADASLRALSFASALASGSAPWPGEGTGPAAGGAAEVAAVLFASAGDVPCEALASYGATAAHVIEPGDLAGYAPQAWARALAGLSAQTGASAVLAAATDRGSEVMAHLGAITGQSLAANCVSAQPADGSTYRIARQRWAGLLLEDALLDGMPALMTVATEAVPATAVADPAALAVHAFQPGLADDDLRVRATESAGQSSGVSLATARVVVGGGRGVGGPDGFAPLIPQAR